MSTLCINGVEKKLTDARVIQAFVVCRGKTRLLIAAWKELPSGVFFCFCSVFNRQKRFYERKQTSTVVNLRGEQHMQKKESGTAAPLNLIERVQEGGGGDRRLPTRIVGFEGGGGRRRVEGRGTPRVGVCVRHTPAPILFIEGNE